MDKPTEPRQPDRSKNHGPTGGQILARVETAVDKVQCRDRKQFGMARLGTTGPDFAFLAVAYGDTSQQTAVSGLIPPDEAVDCRCGNRSTFMKTSFVSIFAAAMLFSGAAFAQSVGEKSGVNSALGIAPATQDFVKEVAMSDMMEIESSKIAQNKGNAEQKKFAGQMITDHTTTSTELKQLVSKGDVKARFRVPSMTDRRRSSTNCAMRSPRTSPRIRFHAGKCP